MTQTSNTRSSMESKLGIMNWINLFISVHTAQTSSGYSVATWFRKDVLHPENLQSSFMDGMALQKLGCFKLLKSFKPTVVVASSWWIGLTTPKTGTTHGLLLTIIQEFLTLSPEDCNLFKQVESTLKTFSCTDTRWELASLPKLPWISDQDK